MSKIRNTSIDIARCIGILIVVFGHLDVNGQISRDLIFSCHMPLFFLLSGVFSSTNQNFKAYFNKNFRTLLLPFFVFLAFDFCVALVQGFISNSLDFLAMLKAYFLALVGIKFYIINTPIWFLFALFLVRLICYFINKNKAFQYVAVAIGIASVFVIPSINIWHRCLPLVILPAIAFYVIGSDFSKQILSLSGLLKKYKFGISLSIILSATIFAWSACTNTHVDMLEYSYGNGVLFFVSAICGIYTIICASNLLSQISYKPILNLLCYFGKNSLYIMLWHYYFTRKIFPLIVEKIGFSEQLYSAPAQIVGAIITIAISVLVIQICNKYLYFLFGKRKSNSQSFV